MKRITLLTVLLASGFAATGTPLFAQDANASAQVPQTVQPAGTTLAPAPDWFGGAANLLLQGRGDVASAKFEEYRVVPKGVAMPMFDVAGSHAGNDFAVFGQNVYQADQRYTGRVSTSWLGVAFDYNQIPHNLGNDARTILTETAPGVWTMNATTRQALGAAVDAVPSAARTYPFYANLLAPTIASAEVTDMIGQRKRGDLVVNVGKKLPFDLAFTYNRDVKSGYRGASGGDILGVVTSAVDVLEPLDEVTQDLGVRWTWNLQSKGDVHASFNRNLYSDRVNALIIDNPFRATDLAYVSTSVPGGPARAQFSTAPDNEANRGAFGAQFKLPRQTRITGDLAFGRWTQNAAFLPYTINSAVFTPTGAPANALSSLQQASLNGRMDTASYNFTFGSRPIAGLGVRLRYRNYSYKDKSNRFVITGDTSGAPDRSWTPADAPTADDPYGHATANRTDSSVGHLEAQASYDLGDLTFEGAYRNLQTSWVGRAASSGTGGSENGVLLSAVYHSRDWLGFRFRFDDATRKVSGIEAGSVAALQGVMADHAERNQTRIGGYIELTPADQYGVTLSYTRRKDDYPNRPFKVAGNPNTESGLLEASYDDFTADFDFTPNPRVELNAFYTYEKNTQTNQWVTMTSSALNNLLTYVPSDKGNTFGFNGVFHLVPDKWTASLLVQHQKIDGLVAITANETGSFYNPGRTTLIPSGQGGAADISSYDDTRLTTVVADLGYTFTQKWTFSVGYWYDKYTAADAFSDGATIFPQSVLFYQNANVGNYNANTVYTRLIYRF